MKKFYFYAVALALAAGMTACGGKNTSNAESGNEAEDTTAVVTAEVKTVEVEAEPEDVKPTPSFRVTAARVYEDIDKNFPISCLDPDSVLAYKPNYYRVYKVVLVCDVLANGKYTGTEERYELLDKDGKKEWVKNEAVTHNYDNRWTVTWRVLGEGSEKVYDLHIGEYSSWFLPEDFDYIYADYERCENFSTYKAYKVINVEKL